MILTIDQLLNEVELAKSRTLLAQASWSDGRITAGTQAALTKNNQQLAEDERNLPKLRQIVMQALSRNAFFLQQPCH